MADKEYSCGAVIFFKDVSQIKYLLIYSARNNEWGFPKGHVEAGETEKQTALREIKEETNLKRLEFIENFRHEKIYEIKKNNKTIVIWI